MAVKKLTVKEAKKDEPKEPVLKFYLEKFRKTLVFQVLEMTKGLIGFSEMGDKAFRSSNGCFVHSGNRVMLDRGTDFDAPFHIYVLGDLYWENEAEHIICMYFFDSDGERDRAYELIMQSLREFADWVRSGMKSESRDLYSEPLPSKSPMRKPVVF